MKSEPNLPAGFGLPAADPAPVAAAEAPADPSMPAATSAGKGGVAILGAKVFFILTGLVQQPLLMRVLGLGEYGALSRILAPSNIFNNVTVSASIQSASRTVAGAENPTGVLRRLMRVHAVFALLLLVVFGGLAPVIGWFQGAPEIVPGLLAMACVLGLYAVYAPLVGSLNGRRLFTRQAGLDVLAATLRTVSLIGMGALFTRMAWRASTGATLGALLAASCIFPVALVVSHVLQSRGAPAEFDRSAYLKGIAGLAAAQFFTNALMQVDIMALGHFLSKAQVGEGNAAHEWVGVYRSCQLFAFLPYQLLVSVTQVLFPLVAKAHAEGDRDKVAQLTQRGLRIGVIVTGLLVSVVIAMPRSLLRLVYPQEVAEQGHATLHLLGLGQGLFAILGLCTTVLASLGRERRAAAITGVATLIVAVLQTVLVSSASFGQAQLLATALATTLGLGVAVLLGAIAVRKGARAFAPATTVLRVAFALGLAFAAGSFEPQVGKLVSLLLPVPIVIAYLALMLITGELQKSEIAALGGVLRRKR